MSIRHRILALVLALVLVESTSYFKLSSFLRWTNEPSLAYGSALAFVGLLLASIVALGSDIPQTIRRGFVVGGCWLFCVQALANLLVGYQLAQTVMPVEVVSSFFGIGAEAALKLTAIVEGASLSVVSISFWSVIAQLLRDQWEAERRRREELQNLESLLGRETGEKRTG